MGDRVEINSSVGVLKVGVLRYLGTTEFAKGEWAGVELDEALGKNDGSVANKRYFTCRPMHGVFAPIAKVNAAPPPPPPPSAQPSSSNNNNKSPIKAPTAISKLRSALNTSQESLTTSEKSSSRLGPLHHKTTLNNNAATSKPMATKTVIHIQIYHYYFNICISLSIIYTLNYDFGDGVCVCV